MITKKEAKEYLDKIYGYLNAKDTYYLSSEFANLDRYINATLKNTFELVEDNYDYTVAINGVKRNVSKRCYKALQAIIGGDYE